MTAVRIFTISLTVFTLLRWHSVASRMSRLPKSEDDEISRVEARLQLCPKSIDLLQQTCRSSLFSCRGRCGTKVQPDKAKPGFAYCACDNLCSVYQDCCWDHAGECDDQLKVVMVGLMDDLEGVKTECIKGNRLITGCKDNGLLEGEIEMSQQSVVSVPRDDQSSLDFKNISVFECNAKRFGKYKVVRWSKRIMGVHKAGSLDILQKYINNENMPHAYQHSLSVSDLPPPSITTRHCFAYTGMLCHLPACSYTGSSDSSFETCQYIMRRHSSSLKGDINIPDNQNSEDSNTNKYDKSKNGDLSSQNLNSNHITSADDAASRDPTFVRVHSSTVSSVHSINPDSFMHDDNKTGIFIGSTVNGLRDDTNTTPREDVEEFSNTTACDISAGWYGDVVMNSNYFIIDASHDQYGNLQIVSSSSNLWPEVQCAKGPRSNCEISVKCGKGMTFFSNRYCIEPETLSLTVKYPAGVNLDSLKVLGLFTKLLPSLDPNEYLEKVQESLTAIGLDTLNQEDTTRYWTFKSYPFNDGSLPLPQLSMARMLAQRFSETQGNQGLPEAFSETNVTLCVHISSYPLSKCNEIITKGVNAFLENAPVSVYSNDISNSAFNASITGSSALKLRALRLKNGLMVHCLILSLTVTLMLVS